jgi:hypothetical protein
MVMCCVFICVGMIKCLVCEQLVSYMRVLILVQPSVNVTDVSFLWHESP